MAGTLFGARDSIRNLDKFRALKKLTYYQAHTLTLTLPSPTKEAAAAAYNAVMHLFSHS